MSYASINKSERYYMRAREFLTEEEMIPWYSRPMPRGKVYPTMPGSSPYEIYRFSVEMADSEKEKGRDPVPRNTAVTVAYTDADEEKIDATEKKTGHKSQKLSTRDAEELKDVNKSSPVAAKKKNKYGV
jgi:hypothetical protein